jgi:glucose-6-phosphate isomerase
MTAGIAPLTSRPAWKALQSHHQKIRDLHLRDLFTADPKRGERLTAEAVGIYLDYSKHRVTDETLTLLRQLAEESGLRQRIAECETARRQLSAGSRRRWHDGL